MTSPTLGAAPKLLGRCLSPSNWPALLSSHRCLTTAGSRPQRKGTNPSVALHPARAHRFRRNAEPYPREVLLPHLHRPPLPSSSLPLPAALPPWR